MDASLNLSGDELRLIEHACRELAARYWRDSYSERNATIKQAIVDGALELEQIADRFGTLRAAKAGRCERGFDADTSVPHNAAARSADLP